MRLGRRSARDHARVHRLAAGFRGRGFASSGHRLPWVGYRPDYTLRKSIIGLGSTCILVFVVLSGGYQGTALIIRYYQDGTSFSNVFLMIHEEKRHARHDNTFLA